jgi:hypothetical protein
MYVGSKERLLDLENTWPIYRGFIYRLASLLERCSTHGSFLTEARCKTDIDRASISAHSLLDDSDPPLRRGGPEIVSNALLITYLHSPRT